MNFPSAFSRPVPIISASPSSLRDVPRPRWDYKTGSVSGIFIARPSQTRSGEGRGAFPRSRFPIFDFPISAPASAIRRRPRPLERDREIPRCVRVQARVERARACNRSAIYCSICRGSVSFSSRRRCGLGNDRCNYFSRTRRHRRKYRLPVRCEGRDGDNETDVERLSPSSTVSLNIRERERIPRSGLHGEGAGEGLMHRASIFSLFVGD